jgi:hypothetical protein
MPLEDGVTLLAFRVAATRFADIRSAIPKGLYVTIGAVKKRRRGREKHVFEGLICVSAAHNLRVIGPAADFFCRSPAK